MYNIIWKLGQHLGILETQPSTQVCWEWTLPMSCYMGRNIQQSEWPSFKMSCPFRIFSSGIKWRALHTLRQTLHLSLAYELPFAFDSRDKHWEIFYPFDLKKKRSNSWEVHTHLRVWVTILHLSLSPFLNCLNFKIFTFMFEYFGCKYAWTPHEYIVPKKGQKRMSELLIDCHVNAENWLWVPCNKFKCS